MESLDDSVTCPRENGFHSTGPRLAICAPSAFHDDLLCRLMQRSVFGQPGSPDERRKHDTCKVRRPPAGALRAQMRADEQHRMVLQVLSDAGQVGAHRDPERPQVRRRADPERISSVGDWMPPAAQDDLARHEFAGLAGHCGFHAGRTSPSNTISEAVACCRMVRLRRARTSASR